MFPGGAVAGATATVTVLPADNAGNLGVAGASQLAGLGGGALFNGQIRRFFDKGKSPPLWINGDLFDVFA